MVFRHKKRSIPFIGEGDTINSITIAEGEVEYVRQMDNFDWNAIRYFGRSEFACKCGGQYCANQLPARAERAYYHLAWFFLDPLRRDVGSACILNSAYRCPGWNKANRGSKRSYHTVPDNPMSQHPSAVDFWFPKKKLITVESYVMGHTGMAKLHGYFYYAVDGFIHLDFRGYKARRK